MLLLVAYVGIELHARDFKPVVMFWRPIFRYLSLVKKTWNPHVSLVQVFATIFFISYLKLLSLVLVPFIFTDFIDDHGQCPNWTSKTHHSDGSLYGDLCFHYPTTNNSFNNIPNAIVSKASRLSFPESKPCSQNVCEHISRMAQMVPETIALLLGSSLQNL